MWFIVLVLAMLLAACGGPAAPRGDAAVTGKIVDATTGDPASNARACFVLGENVTGICAVTDAEGRFALRGLPAGDHQIEVGKEGYTAYRIPVSLQSASTTRVQVPINPRLGPGQIRIVLSWGEEPVDLDSHLWVPRGGGYREVSFIDGGDCGCSLGACLDLDDTNGFGPETITIASPGDGTYSYAVHWFLGGGSWRGSRAVVHVYDESGLVASYRAPSDDSLGVKSWWHVFDLKGNDLIAKNTLSDAPPRPSSIDIEPEW